MSKYKAIVTTAGVTKIAAASAGGKQLKITHMAVGDGNGALPTPNPAQTKLVNEKYRAVLNGLTVDNTLKNHIQAEMIIPADVGGFWLREMGLYDDAGTLIAVSNMAESYKPKLEEGSGRTQTLRMMLIVSSTEAIQIIAGGDTVLATRDFVGYAIKAHEKTRNHPDASTTAKGFVQLSSATTSSDETKAATPKAIKAVNDASAKKAANLADLTNKATARGNLGLGTAATRNVGVEGGNVLVAGAFGLGVGPQHKEDAYGNAAEFFRINATSANRPGNSVYGGVRVPIDGTPTSGYMMVGADLGTWVGRSTTRARGVTWARVYTTQYKPTAADTQAADHSNNFAARMGVVRVLTGANKPTSPGPWSVENSTWTPVAWGSLYVTTNQSNLSTASGNQRFIHYLFIAHGSANKLYVATDVNGTFSGWESYLPRSGGQLSGAVKSSAEITAKYLSTPAGAVPEGGGTYAAQLNTKAPFYQENFDWEVHAGGRYVPLVKGRSNRKGQGYPTAVSFGYLLDGTPSFAMPCIHVRGDNNAEAIWRFDPNSKQLFAPGAFVAGSAVYQTDGNINGTIWGGYLSNWLNNQFTARDNNINNRVDWATYNRDVGARATIDYVNSRTNVAGGRNAWWYKDEVTGFIIQGGVVNRADYNTRVNFPRGYTRECFGVQLTITHTYGWIGDSGDNVQARDLDNGGFNAVMNTNELILFWQSVGV
ncbi:phage tail protein [Serratia marcescens]|uniref:phage tail protein n=1 Tax=Serratia marcescens TaxID=615 RepID=UPI003D184C2A